ncbi:MAG: phosphohydrolase, partial [Synergistaceae bacterium]|nr:phosphohydrolase [Synergistaceae bacterium]
MALEVLTLNAFRGLLNIISHTDLDGVVAAALAWRAHSSSGDPIKISLTGYGEVDNIILEAYRKSERIITLDLSPQFQATADEIDRTFPEGGTPFLFDHHKSTYEKYSNRPWIVVDMNYCGAAVFWNWLMAGNADGETRRRIEPFHDMVAIANDRDLWINENPDGRLWQAMVTLCGEWGALSRLITNPSAAFTGPELDAVTKFVAAQDERFKRAGEHLIKSPVRGACESGDLAFLGDG